MTKLPQFYDPDQVGQLYDVDFQSVFQAAQQLNLSVADEDTDKTLLLLVDVQVDFVFPAPTGRLTVGGAIEDTQRTIEWMYRNLSSITKITASLDTHFPYHIFYSTWWVDAEGNPPDPMTVISVDDVRSGKWKARFEPEWSLGYVEQLEAGGKKQLLIWPYHCLEGTSGHQLVPALAEAIMFHSVARDAQPHYLNKGKIMRSEFYSALEPEVKIPDHPQGQRNTGFLESLREYKRIYVAGQALSHCVQETLGSILDYYRDEPDMIERVHLLKDCASSISGFEDVTEKTIQSYADQGIRLIKSTD